MYLCFVLPDLFHWIQGNVEKGTHGILTSKRWFQFFFLKPFGTKSATSSFHLKSGIFGPASLGILVYTGFLAKEKQKND